MKKNSHRKKILKICSSPAICELFNIRAIRAIRAIRHGDQARESIYNHDPRLFTTDTLRSTEITDFFI